HDIEKSAAGACGARCDQQFVANGALRLLPAQYIHADVVGSAGTNRPTWPASGRGGGRRGSENQRKNKNKLIDPPPFPLIFTQVSGYADINHVSDVQDGQYG